MKKIHQILAFTLILLMMAGVALAQSTATPGASTAPEQKLRPAVSPAASAAPDQPAQASAAAPRENLFAAMEITNMFGEKFDASVFQGKPALINIWTTWCGYCVQEMPALEKLAKEYAGKISIIGLMAEGAILEKDGKITPQQAEIEGARELYKEKSLTYPSLIPNELMFALMYQTSLQSYPTTWFIDGAGMVRHIQVGGHTEEQWRDLIDKFLEALDKEKANGAI